MNLQCWSSCPLAETISDKAFGKTHQENLAIRFQTLSLQDVSINSWRDKTDDLPHKIKSRKILFGVELSRRIVQT